MAQAQSPALVPASSRAVSLLAAMALVGCSGGVVEKPTKSEKLPAGVLARVGAHDIHRKLVTRIAEVQRLPLKEARDKALADARVAVQAQQALPAFLQHGIERAALSRTLLESLKLEAHAKGPISDAELRTFTAKRWLDLDRPASVRTSHAVALKPADGSKEAARRIAAELQAAVRNLRDPTAFLQAARAVPSGDVSVRAERLPFIAEDGRGISTTTPREPTRDFDKAFAQAASQLQNPGDQSGLVETRFGFHVILLEERLPERRVPEADRRRALHAEVMNARALESRTALVEKLAASTPISVSRDIDRATAALLR
jgi:hypothetical protein